MLMRMPRPPSPATAAEDDAQTSVISCALSPKKADDSSVSSLLQSPSKDSLTLAAAAAAAIAAHQIEITLENLMDYLRRCSI